MTYPNHPDPTGIMDERYDPELVPFDVALYGALIALDHALDVQFDEPGARRPISGREHNNLVHARRLIAVVHHRISIGAEPRP